MTWDAHTEFHQVNILPDVCPECAINARHVERWREAIALGPVTDKQATEFGELYRQDWIAWTKTVHRNPPANENDDSEVVVRLHDKRERIESFVVSHHGEEVTLEQIMEETGSARGTAYGYVRSMVLSFRRVGTSLYRVSDPVRTRAEALAVAPATIAQDRSDPSAATVTADVPQIDVERPNRGPSLP